MLLLTAAIGIGTASIAPAQSPDQNPLAGLRFYVDHDSPSWNQWRAYERAGRDSRANMVGRIAREPKAVWVGRFTKPNFHVKVRRIFENAHAQGAVPIMTVLRAQSTRCSPTYDGGGPAEDARTRAWYDDLARAIGLDRVVIARSGRLTATRAAVATIATGYSATASRRCRATRTRRSTSRRAPPTGRARAGWRRSSAGSASRRCVASC
jgi:hypothetical protein